MRIRLLLLVVFAAPRLFAECSLSGGINAPATAYKYSTGNVATAAPDYGVEPLVTQWTWSIGGGTITSTSADGKSITFTAGNGTWLVLNLTMTDANGCTRSARSQRVDLVNAPASCPSLTLDTTLTAPAAANQRSVAVSASCEWSVGNLPAWITVVSGQSGNGNGTIVLALQRNAAAVGRRAIFTVNEQEVFVSQQGVNSIYPDYNRDGRTDLLWRFAGGAPGVVFAQYMNGTATASGRWLTGEANPAWNAYPAADFDGNGMSDMYWVKPGASNNAYDLKLVQEGYGVVSYDTGAYVLVGFADSEGYTTTHPLWLGPGTSIYYAKPYPYAQPYWTQPAGWELMAVADLDGNLRNDLLYRHSTDGRVFAALRHPTSLWTSTSAWMASGTFHNEPNLQWQIAATGDVNGDGRADLIWRNMTDGRIWTMLMNGLSWTAGAVVWTEPDTHWVLKGSGDFNGDGRGDLLFRNDLTGVVFVVLLDGNNVLASGVAHYEPDMNWRLVGPTTTRAMSSMNSSSVP